MVIFSLLKVEGDVSYNGFKLEDFIPQKTSAYVSQHDLHIPELTVRETLDFSARCQGSGRRAGITLYLKPLQLIDNIHVSCLGIQF